MAFCYSCGGGLSAQALFCQNCGSRQPTESRASFNGSTGTGFNLIGLSANLKRPRLFVAKNEWLFWVYIFGYLTQRLLSADYGGIQLIAIINLVELVAFIVGFSRSKHNWLVIWHYALITSLALTWLGYATGQIIWLNGASSVVAILWLGTVATLAYGFVGLSRRLGLSPWMFDQSPRAW